VPAIAAFQTGQPVWVSDPDGSARPAEYVGQRATRSSSYRGPTAFVIYLDGSGGDAVALSRVAPRAPAGSTRDGRSEPSRLEAPSRPGGGIVLKISARNKFAGTIVAIHKGEAIANVVLDVGGHRIVASITVEAVDELGLKVGESATAVIKASDVMIATG
jgi:molybdopterin-binding protein